MPNGYEQIYLALIPRLAACDLAANAPRLGLEVTADGALRAELFGRQYVVSAAGVDAVDGAAADPNERSLVAIYAISGGQGDPGDDFVPVFRLYAGVDGGTFDKMRLHAGLLDEFAATVRGSSGRPGGWAEC